MSLQPGKTVTLYNDQGEEYDIPEDQIEVAKKAGLKEGVEMYDNEDGIYDVPPNKVEEALKGGLLSRDGKFQMSKPVGTGEALKAGFVDAFPVETAGNFLEAAVPTDSWIRKIVGEPRYTDKPELKGKNFKERLAFIEKAEKDYYDRVHATNPTAFNTGKAGGVVTQVAIPAGVALRGTKVAEGAGSLLSKAGPALTQGVKKLFQYGKDNPLASVVGGSMVAKPAKELAMEGAAALPFAYGSGVEVIANAPKNIKDWLLNAGGQPASEEERKRLALAKVLER